jgi:galactosylceramidase
MIKRLFLVLALGLTAGAGTSQTIVVDGRDTGRVFEGVGMLSAGASSRLLYDYPEPYRSDILDYLFKPDFGASLPELKVEMGGDVNSTDGSELCYAHTREEFLHPKPYYFLRGYEAWLIQEAKKRNPRIKVEILQWGAPGWVGEGKFYSRDNAELIARYILGLEKYAGVKVDYTGIRNEVMYSIPWIKELRKVLDSCGLTAVKIDAGDQWRPGNQWRIAGDIARDSALARDVYAINAHVPEEVNFVTPPDVRRIGKPIWSGESHARGGDWYAAAKAARINNLAYPVGRITRIIYWSLITSYPDYLTAPGSGLMKANTPWSGRYQVQPPLWIAAHTNQFAHPGWRYMDGACQRFSPQGWSVVALRDTATGDYSIIVETMHAKEPQTIHFRVTGGLSTRPLAVWSSSFKKSLFVRQPSITPDSGSFTLTIAPNCIYSLTTTRGQHKGVARHPVPASSPFPRSYQDDFDHDSTGKEPPFMINYHGAFEVTRAPRTRNGYLRQYSLSQGINWFSQPYPRMIFGDSSWKNIDVSVAVRVPDSGTVGIDCRLHQFSWNSHVPGYGFRIGRDGQWKLISTGDNKTLAGGSWKPMGDRWHQLRFRVKGDRLQAWVDGDLLVTRKDSRFHSGVAALATGWNEADFDRFSVTADNGTVKK